mgnify:CR=1 FL=1|jgi:hypothetical protein
MDTTQVEKQKPFLRWQDFAELFSCGRNKAMLLMHQIGVVYIGRVAFVRSTDLTNYLAKHGSIDIDWSR